MFSQTIEYALRAMMHLAALPAGLTVNSEEIAKATRVPQRYLSKVLRDLVLADLISSQRGPRGGFCLRRDPSGITMLDVVNAVDPIARIDGCPLGNPTHSRLCVLHQRIDNALHQIETAFRSTTLAQVLQDLNTGPQRCEALLKPAGKSKGVTPTVSSPRRR
jgi:Rrf2 family protein